MGAPEDHSNTHINLSFTFDRVYWSRKFHVSEDELAQAVAAVGTVSIDVQRYLAANPPKRAPELPEEDADREEECP